MLVVAFSPKWEGEPPFYEVLAPCYLAEIESRLRGLFAIPIESTCAKISGRNLSFLRLNRSPREARSSCQSQRKNSFARLWFSRKLAAVAMIEEASSVRERNDAEDLDALA